MRVRVQLTVTEVITVSRLVEADTTDEAEKKVEALWRSERGEHERLQRLEG